MTGRFVTFTPIPAIFSFYCYAGNLIAQLFFSSFVACVGDPKRINLQQSPKFTSSSCYHITWLWQRTRHGLNSSNAIFKSPEC